MDSTPNFGSRGRDRYVFTVYHPGWMVTTPGVLISVNIVVGVIFSGRKGGYLYNKTPNSTRIPNLASKILGAICHIFRDIDVYSAFPLAALLGATMGKALKTSIYRNI